MPSFGMRRACQTPPLRQSIIVRRARTTQSRRTRHRLRSLSAKENWGRDAQDLAQCDERLHDYPRDDGEYSRGHRVTVRHLPRRMACHISHGRRRRSAKDVDRLLACDSQRNECKKLHCTRLYDWRLAHSQLRFGTAIKQFLLSNDI